MRRDKLVLYLHLVWATWDRLPLITRELERPILRCVEDEARGMKCPVVAINSMPDHVHALVILAPTVSISDLVKKMKGVSSRFANTLLGDEGFKWQGTYGAFTVSRWDVDKIAGYVKGQKEHHDNNELDAELEEAAVVTPAQP